MVSLGKINYWPNGQIQGVPRKNSHDLWTTECTNFWCNFFFCLRIIKYTSTYHDKVKKFPGLLWNATKTRLYNLYVCLDWSAQIILFDWYLICEVLIVQILQWKCLSLWCAPPYILGETSPLSAGALDAQWVIQLGAEWVLQRLSCQLTGYCLTSRHVTWRRPVCQPEQIWNEQLWMLMVFIRGLSYIILSAYNRFQFQNL